MNWIKRLLRMCDHQWKIIEHIRIETESHGCRYVEGHMYHLQCAKCGDVKRRKMSNSL